MYETDTLNRAWVICDPAGTGLRSKPKRALLRWPPEDAPIQMLLSQPGA